MRQDASSANQLENDSGKTPGLFGMPHMETDLSEIIGRKADLHTAENLNRSFRDEVVRAMRETWGPHAAALDCEGLPARSGSEEKTREQAPEVQSEGKPSRSS
jgi:hypothetical protein